MIPLLKLVVEDLNAVHTETRIDKDKIDDFEMGNGFGRDLCWKAATAVEAVLKVTIKFFAKLLNVSSTPRFWS